MDNSLAAAISIADLKAEYDELKKVYSIWICMESPQYIGNAISSYSLEKKDIVEGIPDKKQAYDKLSVVLV